MSTSIQQRLALVTPPLWVQVEGISGFATDAWLVLFDTLATMRAQAVERGVSLTSTLRVTSAELAKSSGALLALFELLTAFGLLAVEPEPALNPAERAALTPDERRPVETTS